MSKLINRVLLSAVGAALVVPAAVQATDEITVSAQRREANIQEVPISVTALTNEDMQRLQVNFTADIAKNVPNLQTYTVTAGAAAMQVFMRGAGVQNPGFNAAEAPVGIYIDDIYRGRVGTVNLELADVERIEVLRGPQGTLYGRNTIAGAIKVVTRTPGEEFYANASVGMGSFETTKVTGSVGGEVADGVGLSIAGLYNDRGEGWIQRGSVGGRKLGEYDNKAVRTKLSLHGDDVFKAIVSLEYVDAENDGYNAIPYGPTISPASTPGNPVAGFYTTLVPDATAGLGLTKQGNASLDMSWAFESFTFRSLTSYSDVRDRFRFDLNGGAFDLPPILPSPTGGLLINSLAQNDTLSQEFSFSGGNDSVDWIAGMFFMKESGEQDYRANLDIFGLNLLEATETDTQSYALFGEATWQISDTFALTAGARWTLDDKEYTNNCSGTLCNDGAVVPTPGPWTNDIGENFNEFTPRLLAQWQLTDDTMVFAGISRGFQAGGFQTLCLGNQLCNRVIYDPQTVVSWEAGVKTDVNSHLRLNVSAFYAQYDGLQQTAIDNVGGSFPIQNVGDVDVKGLEIEATVTATDNLEFWAAVGLADEDISGATLAKLAPAASKGRLPGMPRRTVRLGVDYHKELTSEWELVAGLDMDYASGYYATINNVVDIPQYTRYNGRIGLEHENAEGVWSVFLSGTNLNDSEDLYSGIAGNGTNIRTPQPPREYMLTFNYRR